MDSSIPLTDLSIHRHGISTCNTPANAREVIPWDRSDSLEDEEETRSSLGSVQTVTQRAFSTESNREAEMAERSVNSSVATSQNSTHTSRPLDRSSWMNLAASVLALALTTLYFGLQYHQSNEIAKIANTLSVEESCRSHPVSIEEFAFVCLVY